MPNAHSLSELKVGAIINTSSGGCDLESEQKMLRILTHAGIAEPKVWCGEAKEMERFFRRQPGNRLIFLSCLEAMARFRELQEHAPKRLPFLFRFQGER